MRRIQVTFRTSSWLSLYLNGKAGRNTSKTGGAFQPHGSARLFPFPVMSRMASCLYKSLRICIIFYLQVLLLLNSLRSSKTLHRSVRMPSRRRKIPCPDGFDADVDPENAYDVSRDQMDGQELEFEDTTAMNREHYVDTGYVYATISV